MKTRKCRQCGKQYKPQYQNGMVISVFCPACKTKRDNAKKREQLKKETKRQLSIKNLDRLWGLTVRERANHKCELCGQPANQPHHIYSRANSSTRWDLDNGVCLCHKHHKFDNKISAHKAGVEFTEWLYAYKSKEFMEKLKRKAHQTIVNDDNFRKKILKQLKEMHRKKQIIPIPINAGAFIFSLLAYSIWIIKLIIK